MVRGRLLATGYAVLSLLFAGWFLVAVLTADSQPIEHSDYMSYHAAGDIVGAGDGGCLYEPECQQAAQRRLMPPDLDFTRGLPFNNPPSLAVLAVPFAALSLAAGFTLWNLVGVAAFGAAVARLGQGLKPHGRVIATVLALTAWPTVTAVLRGQVSLLVAALMIGSIALLPTRPGRSGVLLGLATLKPTLVPLIGLWAVARRSWVAIGAAILTGLVLLLIAAAIVGPGSLLAYPAYALGQLGDADAAGIHPEQMINWRAAALWLGLPTEAVVIASVATLIVVAAILWGTGVDGTIAPAAALFATPLVVPHANQHEAILAVAAWLLLVVGLGDRHVWLAPTAITLHLLMWLALPLWGDAAARLTLLLLLGSLAATAYLAWRQSQAGMLISDSGQGSLVTGSDVEPG